MPLAAADLHPSTVVDPMAADAGSRSATSRTAPGPALRMSRPRICGRGMGRPRRSRH